MGRVMAAAGPPIAATSGAWLAELRALGEGQGRCRVRPSATEVARAAFVRNTDVRIRHSLEARALPGVTAPRLWLDLSLEPPTTRAGALPGGSRSGSARAHSNTMCVSVCVTPAVFPTP